MGKGTDKLYITHSEWASEDAFSASAGSGLTKASGTGVPFKRLPFNFCAISLQPFKTPVCTPDGTIFDIDNILPWLLKHGTNPVNGAPLQSTELIKLNFAKNDDGEMVDPVTFKVFTDNTHIVALRTTGNVFAHDTVERLNIKAKMWEDLVSGQEFGRKDIISLQDPQNVESRNLSSFKYLKDGTSTLTPQQQRERNDPSKNVNLDALGSAADVFALRQNPAEIAKSLTKNLKTSTPKPTASPSSSTSTTSKPASSSSNINNASKPYNAALHTTGRAAASFTSTGLTPHTTAERALLSDEDYMLHPRRVKTPGYARLSTSLGALNLELLPEFAPKAVWNFVQLSKRGYYTSTSFHRNIRNFMIQGGDPTGTGKGGASCWGKSFGDEFDGPLSHALGRGLVSMANKGKNTNGSQFFILYRPAKHLDRKHTIFARVVGGLETLAAMEKAEVGEGDRPVEEIRVLGVDVFVDPFEEFLEKKREAEEAEGVKKELERQGGKEDERTTWTGKRVRGVVKGDGAAGGGVGKYLHAASPTVAGGVGQQVAEEWEVLEEPVKKKVKAGGGGFGNFDSW